ncbi:MAG: restriction endonuclease subunit S [Pseudomonadales bacterium]|nr:restriction endonuclease subunit S [Pseudomonadales bacterium]
MTKALLKDIAEIRVGHTFRGKVPKDPVGEMAYLTIRDLTEGGTVSPHQLERIEPLSVNEQLILRHQDILLPGRGEHYRAALFCEGERPSYPVIASNLVFIIRARPERALPLYLSWVLSQEKTESYLKGVTRGSNMLFLPKGNLEALGVDLPPLETQQRIVELISVQQKQQALLKELARNSKNLTQVMVQKLVKRSAGQHK